MPHMFEDIAALSMADVAVREAVKKKADEMVEYGQSIAPVFGDRPPKRAEPADGEPGAYRDSITSKDINHHGLPARRVYTDDKKAFWIEIGTRHMPEYAVFTKIADAFGGGHPTLEQGVETAQGALRDELTKYNAMKERGASKSELAGQKAVVDQKRMARTSAYRAARRDRRRGRR